MSHYYPRFCGEHGEWDDDVDCPSEGCPTCIQEGKLKTRSYLFSENAKLKALLGEVVKEIDKALREIGSDPNNQWCRNATAILSAVYQRIKEAK